MLNLPKNIYIISIVMALSFATTSMMALIAGLLGANIAPSPELATLPIAMMVVGTACATIPAAMLMKRVGRKIGLAIGILVALTAALLAFYAATKGNFWLFSIAAVMIGFNAAFTQQGRFVIIENATSKDQQADGLTLGLMANLLAAIIGPLIGAKGKDLLPSAAGYAGSFAMIACVLALGLLILMLYRNVPIQASVETHSNRSLKSIVSQPLFILAAGSAAVGFGVMAFVMTATPVSMHEIHGHSLEHTTFIIQSHIIAMYLPSFISGFFIKRGNRTRLIQTGLFIYLAVCAVAYSGQAVLHYWWALALLGVGWNLLFMTSTAMLPETYSETEKFKAQATNDFLIFSTQAIAAFGAGWVLFNFGWNAVITIALTGSLVWIITVMILRYKINKTPASNITTT